MPDKQEGFKVAGEIPQHMGKNGQNPKEEPSTERMEYQEILFHFLR